MIAMLSLCWFAPAHDVFQVLYITRFIILGGCIGCGVDSFIALMGRSSFGGFAEGSASYILSYAFVSLCWAAPESAAWARALHIIMLFQKYIFGCIGFALLSLYWAAPESVASATAQHHMIYHTEWLQRDCLGFALLSRCRSHRNHPAPPLYDI